MPIPISTTPWSYTPVHTNTLIGNDMAKNNTDFGDYLTNEQAYNGEFATVSNALHEIAVNPDADILTARTSASAPYTEFVNEQEKTDWSYNSKHYLEAKLNNTGGTVTATGLIQDRINITTNFTGYGIKVYLDNPTEHFVAIVGDNYGDYLFTYLNSKWMLSYNMGTPTEVNLSDYFIVIELGTEFVVEGDSFKIQYLEKDPSYSIVKDMTDGIIPRKTSEFENDSEFVNYRDGFFLENVTITDYLTNDDDDSSTYPYKVRIRLNDYPYDKTLPSGTKLNYISEEEIRIIEKYTAIIAFGVSDASSLSIAPYAHTVYYPLIKEGYVEIPSVDHSAVGKKIPSLVFIKTNRADKLERYKLASYIASTNAHQYIDTGIGATDGFVAELLFTLTDIPHSIMSPHDIMGVTVGGVSSILRISEDHWEFVNGSTHISTLWNKAEIGKTYFIKVVGLNGTSKIFINETEVASGAGNPTKGAGNIYLFASNNGGTPTNFSSIKLYYAKIYSPSTGTVNLERDFAPIFDNGAASGDYAAGLFDFSANTYAAETDRAYFNEDTASGVDFIIGIDENLKDYIISGQGAPTLHTKGVIGQFYKDIDSGEFYICTAVIQNTAYKWERSSLGITYSINSVF